MSIFILVHGSFHGGWTWEKFAPLLRQFGHTVLCPTLPGSAGDPTPAAEATLDSYARAICAIIDAQSEPVILVGHSMGGIVVTEVAERRSERVRLLVYVCGFLFEDGESLTGFLEHSKHLAGDELVLRNMVVAPDGLTAHFPPDKAEAVFYNCCLPEDAAWATSRLAPQALAVYGAPVHVTAERFGTVPKVYVQTLRDRAIDIAYQQKMVDRTPCRDVYMLNTDHSPFLSMPKAMAAILLTE